jgi:hypothetical protein
MPTTTRLRRSAALAMLPATLALAACGSNEGGGGGGSPSASQPAALVQVENAAAARPQSGLQSAAVVYEYVTEGGISRFSAIYTSPPSGRIGPVRSARLVTIHLARIYGAVIVYSGASTAVQQALDQSQLPHVDEKSAHGDLYRVGGRPAPHNLVTDGDHLRDLLSHVSGATSAPPLWSRNSTASQGVGTAVSRFTVPVSDSETPTFTWDAGAGGWRRSEPDTGNVVDADTNAPLVASTVIVQQVQITQTSDVEDVNGVHGVDITLTGSGQAQVFTGGREMDATWNQPASGVPTFTMSSGGAAPIASGLVWICLVASGARANGS